MAKDFSRAFYKSREWQAVRDMIRMRDKYLCVRCGQYGQEVHHKIYLTAENIWDESITLNPSNLELLCFDCHKKEHKRHTANAHIKDEGLQAINKTLDTEYMFDDNGMLIRKA